jgi:mono/diheme cytochrome c family protein
MASAALRRLPLVALLLAAGACTRREAGAAPPQPDAARLYRLKCASCHRLKEPAEHDAATWQRAVERFGRHLSTEERAALAAYLSGRAPRPVRPREGPQRE